MGALWHAAHFLRERRLEVWLAVATVLIAVGFVRMQVLVEDAKRQSDTIEAVVEAQIHVRADTALAVCRRGNTITRVVNELADARRQGAAIEAHKLPIVDCRALWQRVHAGHRTLYP